MAMVFIALGANLGDPLKQAQAAISIIEKLPAIKIIQISSFYRSKPLVYNGRQLGVQDQPDYLNAVIKIETLLSPIELLNALQNIEKKLGRVRGANRWEARTLDLDILLYDNVELQTQVLTIPHYDMKNREFVLYPLFDIAPDLILPDKTKLTELIKSVPRNNMTYW